MALIAAEDAAKKQKEKEKLERKRKRGCNYFFKGRNSPFKSRDLLEENAYHLTDRCNMHDYVPFILKEEEALIKQEIEGKFVYAIFDGTSRLGEALAIVLRFISDDWKLEQRLIRVQMLSKALSGEEIARELINVLSVTYRISSYRVLATTRDRASANNVAMQTVKIVFPLVVNVGCFSHTLNHIGSYFNTPTLNEFNLFSHSPKARLLWKSRSSHSMPRYSATQW